MAPVLIIISNARGRESRMFGGGPNGLGAIGRLGVAPAGSISTQALAYTGPGANFCAEYKKPRFLLDVFCEKDPTPPTARNSPRGSARKMYR